MTFARLFKRLMMPTLLGLIATTSAFAQTSAFTYQGRLTDGGTAANGIYDLQFALFDSISGGSQIGASQTVANVTVTGGVFTVTLGFGPSAFPGANRFLEISAKLSGAGAFTLLTPRQHITSTPYAVRSLMATTADGLSSACVGCVQDANINTVAGSKVSGAIPVAGVPAGSNSYIQNTTSPQSGDFNVSGSGTANILDAITQYNQGGVRVLRAVSNGTFLGVGAGSVTTGADNSFFGVNAGKANTSGSDNAFFGSRAGLANTSGNSNTFVGAFSGQGDSSGKSNTAIGVGAGYLGTSLEFATAIGAGSSVSTSNTIAFGRGNGADTVVVHGQLELGTIPAAGGTQLCLNGSNRVGTCSSSLRYKTNLAPYRSGLNVINRLRPISFTWKDGGLRDLGFGAEEVEKIDPLLVTYNKEGQVEGVKYDRINVALVNAVKEQQQQIESLRKENSAMAARLQVIEQSLAKKPRRARR